MSELQGLQSKQPELKQHRIQTLSVALAPLSDVQFVAQEYGITYPLLSDAEGKVIDLYGLRHKAGSMEGTDIARPAIFLIDNEGRIVWRHFADNWRVRIGVDEILEQMPKKIGVSIVDEPYDPNRGHGDGSVVAVGLK